MIRKYEACFLVRADISEEETAKEVKFIQDAITGSGCELVKTELWGKRTLAYPVKKKTEASYAFFYFQGEPETIAKIKEHFAVRETVLRSLFIQRKTLPAPEKETPAQEKTDGQSQ